MKKVLDHGYVRLVNNMGSDLDVVNAARVSFDKEVAKLENKDERLIEFLVQHKHDSCLRHCVMTFEVYAPLMVARQWYKHVVAASALDDQLGWNESSRRYITENEEFYVPEAWRSVPENRKQGSGDNLDLKTSQVLSGALAQHIDTAYTLYKNALEVGVAPEQARLFLPAYAMYVRWRWTASLNAVLHFIALRNATEAQAEIQEYSKAIETITYDYYPITSKYWNKYR